MLNSVPRCGAGGQQREFNYGRNTAGSQQGWNSGREHNDEQRNLTTAGSGVLLTNEWVLTAKHVASRSDFAKKQPRFSLGYAEREPNKYLAFDHPTRDVSLFKMRTPFLVDGSTNGWKRAIADFSDTPSLLAANPKANCLGYALNNFAPDMARFTLGADQFESSTSPPHQPDPFLFRAWYGPGLTIDQGDSGGPCLTLGAGPSGKEEILGLDREQLASIGFSWIESAPGFRPFVMRIMNSLAAIQANFDGDPDQKPDTCLAERRADDWIWVTCAFNSEDFLPGIPITPFLNALPILPMLAAGDFDGNGSDDMMALIDSGLASEQLLYFDQAAFASMDLTQLHTGFALGWSGYDGFAVRDVDGDGRADVDAHRPDGFIDTYYGGESGLKPIALMNGFPSADGDDGRFLNLTSPELQTVVFSSLAMNIWPQQDQTEIRIEVFDGDIGGLNDNPNSSDSSGLLTVGCYALRACSSELPASCSMVGVWSDRYFNDSDNRWKSLHYAASDLPYRYELRASIGSCVLSDCDVPCDSQGNPAIQSPVPSTSNVFKVRSDGSIGTDSPAWSFMAVDSEGPAVWMSSSNYPDTTYDGTFNYYLFVGPGADGVHFTDCDADFTKDGQFDPDDEENPASASGQSDRTRFAMVSVDDAKNPTSQFPDSTVDPAAISLSEGIPWYVDPSGGLECESHYAQAKTTDQWWKWQWDGVLAINNIEVKWATGAPGSAPYSFIMDRSGRGRPSPSAARPISWWKDQTARIPALLPLRIGGFELADAWAVEQLVSRGPLSCLPSGESSQAWVNSLDAGKRTVCHQGSSVTVGKSALQAHLGHGDDLTITSAVGEMIPKLIVARLNVAAAAKVGEDLNTARIYARQETVEEVLTVSDEAVQSVMNSCAIGEAGLEHIRWLSRRLDTINSGGVTYVQIPESPRRMRSVSSLRAISPQPVPCAPDAASLCQ